MPRKPTGRRKKKSAPYRGILNALMDAQFDARVARDLYNDTIAYDAFARAVEANPDGYTSMPLP